MRLLVEAKSGDRAEEEEALAVSFFPETDLGRKAAKAHFRRIRQRTQETTGGEEPNHSLLYAKGTQDQLAPLADGSTFNTRNSAARLGELKMPVLVMNGEEDALIPTSQSWELLKGIEDAQLIIYPQSGHGFLRQYAERVADDVNRFLNANLQDMVAKL